MNTQVQTPRNEDVKIAEACDVISKQYFDKTNAEFQQRLKTYPELLTPELELALRAQTKAESYYSTQWAGGLIGIGVDVNFWPWNGAYQSTFGGLAGGLGFGEGKFIGSAWLNYPPWWLAEHKWSARFQVTITPVTINVFMWGLSGEYIGSAFGTGSFPTGFVGGGQGSFDVESPPPPIFWID